MKKLNVMALIFFFVILGQNVAQASSLESGQKDFKTYCAPCHGKSGTGDGPVAGELIKKPVDLTVFAKAAGGVFPERKVKKMVDGRAMARSHGSAEMPVWGQWFSYQAMARGLLQEDRETIKRQVDDRLDSLMIYLKTIQK